VKIPSQFTMILAVTMNQHWEMNISCQSAATLMPE